MNGTDNLPTILCYATRYALGRSSYAPSDVMRAIKSAELERRDIIVLARDIKDALDRDPEMPYAGEWRHAFAELEARYERSV